MGAFEAYAGALAFRLFGTSVMSMRYVTITLYAAFLTGLYLLTSRLYTRAFALLTIAIFVFVSPVTLQFQILSVGGYAEIVPLCVFLILVSYFLAYHSRRAPGPNNCSSISSGVGWPVCSVVRPTGCSLCNDRRYPDPAILLKEILKWGIWPLLLGLCLCSFPLIYYNLHAAPGSDSLSTLISLSEMGSDPHVPFWRHISATFLSSIPGNHWFMD